MVALPTPASDATASMGSAPYPTSASRRRMAARITPSRLGSRGRPPRLGRGISVVGRTAMSQTLDTKDEEVPEFRAQGTASRPEVLSGPRAPGRKLGNRQSSCGGGNDVRRGVQLPPE